MSGLALMVFVGGTQMVVQMSDHFDGLTSARIAQSSMTCRTCGALTVDYAVHLAWHIQRGELSLVQPEKVMPDDVTGDEVGAPEQPRNLRSCTDCGHVHVRETHCGQPWRGNPRVPCPCDTEQ